MTNDLIIRTENGDFDLFGSEDIVQTISVFNLEDISGRYGEYTNSFKMPLTNNNVMLIGYANFISSVGDIPYTKIRVDLIPKGSPFKSGFLAIESITDVIEARFYCGNSVFYDIIKGINLPDLPWEDFDHIWDYTNAVANASNTTGFVYPVINYGGQNTASDIVDIRKILPATYEKEVLSRMFSFTGYTPTYNFDTSDIDRVLFPYAKQNPQYSSDFLLLNSVDASNTNQQAINEPTVVINWSQGFTYERGGTTNKNGPFIPYIPTYNQFAAGTSTYYNTVVSYFICQQGGSYDVSFFIDMLNFDFASVVTSNINPPGSPNVQSSTKVSVQFVKISGINSNIEHEEIVTTATTVTSSVNLQQGDYLQVKLKLEILVFGLYLNGSATTTITFNPVLLATTALTIQLDPTLVFGGQITYSSMLPNLKCSEVLKDICIRNGLILLINDDDKTIEINRINTLYDNIQNAVDWSRKLDESDPPEISFKYDSYAQSNWFKHKADKSILSIPVGSDYNLTISNQNLTTEKTLYNSPFSVSDLTEWNGIKTTFIDLYNTSDGDFTNDVEPRILFSRVKPSAGGFKFTDGTSTSGYIDTVVCWFVNIDTPEFGMGFANNLIPKNSAALVSILQNLKIVKANFNLNIIDIKNFNPFIPVYVDKFQSYFFISSINQYNYTKANLTEVELIKLNI